MSRLHLAVFATLIALGSASVYGAAPGSVSGVVRDSSGMPLIGAVVQLLRTDQSIAASVYTDDSGHFLISSLPPGRYALKAIAASFLPSMREDLRVRSRTVVNLTLNTLYEVMQWLPAEPRAASMQADDWTWTLRSAANRPLLRWLEDGPLVVVSDGTNAHPRLKARLVASGQEGTFGESGERISASVEETPSDSRELLAHVDFSPNSTEGMESMLGFRQDLGFAGSVESVASVAVHPELDGPIGFDAASLRSLDTINLGDEFEAEVGSEQVIARITGGNSTSVIAALPFASLAWRQGDSKIGYGFTTILPGMPTSGSSEARAGLPALSVRDGRLTLEHGVHQQIGWSRSTDASSAAILVFADRVDHPVIEAMSHFASDEPADLPASALFDQSSKLLHGAGSSFSTTGLVASLEHRLPGGNQLRLAYASGDALLLPTQPSGARAATLAQVFAAARPHRAQSYTISLSGTLEGTGTHWRASYRWQPESSITAVAPFAADAAAPYCNLLLRQPIHLRREGLGSLEGLLDIRNLLAQGFQPYLLSDGSLLILTQEQRSFRAGLSFSF